MGVRGGVGRIVVRAQVGLDFDDAAGQPSGAGAVREDLAEQPRGDLLRRGLKK